MNEIFVFDLWTKHEYGSMKPIGEGEPQGYGGEFNGKPLLLQGLEHLTKEEIEEALNKANNYEDAKRIVEELRLYNSSK